MSKTPSRSSHISAFNLVELLTVIGIVGILAAILIPLGVSIRNKARESTCASNLRQLGTAIGLLTNDNHGRLPYIVASSQIPGSVDRHWRRQVLPYVGLPATSAGVTKSPFICPPLSGLIADSGNAPQIPNYGLNINLEAVMLITVQKPAQTLLATEAKLTAGSPQEQISASILKDSAVPGGKVHRGGQNILYVDGHVEWFEDARRLGDAPYTAGGDRDVWTP